MNFKQMSIFDSFQDDIKSSILKRLNKYGIDDEYLNLGNGTHTFKYIYENLSKNPRYRDYILTLFECLKEYIGVSQDAYGDFYNEEDFSTMSLNNKDDNFCIIIYSSQKRSIGPCYCLSMIPEEILGDDKDVI